MTLLYEMGEKPNKFTAEIGEECYNIVDKVSYVVDKFGDVHTTGREQIPSMESGSNTNGNWTKFADGTLLCTRVISISSSVQETWTYPIPCISEPHITHSKDGGGTAIPSATIIGGITPTSVFVNIWQDTQGTIVATSTVSLGLIGRWK